MQQLGLVYRNSHLLDWWNDLRHTSQRAGSRRRPSRIRTGFSHPQTLQAQTRSRALDPRWGSPRVEFPEDWAGAAVLGSLELFITSMVLGLVGGDLGILRDAGLGASRLLDIYRLSSLLAWGSGLVVAAGSAITALIVGGVEDVFVLALRSAGVVPHAVPTPSGR
jgi:hypothetical protein